MSKRAEKYIVLDASVVVDLFAGRDRDRVDVAEKFFKCIKDSGKSIRVFAVYPIRSFIFQVVSFLYLLRMGSSRFLFARDLQ